MAYVESEHSEEVFHASHQEPSNGNDVFSERIRQWLEDVLPLRSVEAEGDDDGTKKLEIQRRRRKRKLIAVSLLAVAIASLRFWKRQRQKSSSLPQHNQQPQLFWPIGLLIDWYKGPEYQQSPQESTMSLLWNAARDGVIQQALIGSSSVYFQTKRQSPSSSGKELQWNRAILPADEAMKSGLLEALASGGCTDVQAIPESIWSRLAAPLLTALPFVYLALVYRLMKNQFGGDDVNSKLFTSGTSKLSFWGRSNNNKKADDRTTFADVAGLSPVVQDLKEVVSYLSNPSLYNSLGARPPKGVLLHGPPGSGKTLLARAVAGEAHCDSFTALSGSSFVEMYVGRGAARVRSLFAKARRDALRQRKLHQSAWWWSSVFGFPSKDNVVHQRPACAIVFIDEFDAVAKTRSSDSFNGNDEREQTLNQLLTEMDGFDTGSSSNNNEQNYSDKEVTLIVIAASNRLDVIDEAVLRRFDRQIYVGWPDEGGRKDILLVHAKKTKCSADVDWDLLASDTYTHNFSGADLENVVNHGALNAIRSKCSVVEQSHLVHAAQRISHQKAKVGERQALPRFFASID